MLSRTIFSVVSCLGKMIELTAVQWSHITLRHRELRGQIAKMKLTLVEPDRVYYSSSEGTHYFYRRFARTPVSQKYLLLVVKHRNGQGFIITAFFTRRVRTQGRVRVYE